jgi:hypothetical protein
MIMAATMTDPLLPDREISASAAERLAALRQPSTSKKRTKPAHTSKVLAAGVSTTALFGMVAFMGYQSGNGAAQASALPVAMPTAAQTAAPTPIAPTVAPLVPTTAAPVVVPTPTAAVPAAPVQVTPVQVAPVPVIEVPVVQVPVAVAAAQSNAGGTQSNTTTKSSG